MESPASKFLTGSFLPERFVLRPAVVVVAHPDDEILGVGTLLPLFRNLRAIVHVTDGAPRRGSDAVNAGVNSWQEYAVLRRREFFNAMRTAGAEGEFICLGHPDQGASFQLPSLTAQLRRLCQRLHPAVIFTHSYEGGHPDHDACSAAVSFACSLTGAREKRPEVLEFASYHFGPTENFEAERFLGHSLKLWPHTLTLEEQQFKRDLAACYPSQQAVLAQFPLREEPIRIAPKYDFSKPPHRGKLHYENYGWGMTGRRWRQLARRAMTMMGLAPNV